MLNLAQEDIPVYKKADKNSQVVGRTPAGMTQIDTDYRVEGLSGDGPYWHVSNFEKGVSLWGFIHNDFVG